jgi:hypothetical protein
MVMIRIIKNLEGAAKSLEVDGVKRENMENGTIVAIGGMPDGMESGQTSVGMVVKADDGKSYYCETSLKMLQLATTALTAEYGDETGSYTVGFGVEN